MRGSELARLVLSRHWEGRGPGAHREAKSITIYAGRKNLHGQKRSDRGRRACAASCPPVHDRAGGGERVATVAATQTRRRPRTHCRRCTWAGSVTSTMTRPCLEWGALLSTERPAMELRADASPRTTVVSLPRVRAPLSKNCRYLSLAGASNDASNGTCCFSSGPFPS